MSQFQSTTKHSSPEQPAFRVREATPEDNAALLTLDRQCVVAAATPVAFDRSPDFFTRSRPYAHWRTYVAEGESGLIGVGAMALKRVLVDAQPVEAAYFYDLRVAPAYRRLGVAKAVGDAVRAYTRSLGPAIGYSLVMQGNVASLSFVQGRGSRPRRSCALSLIPLEGIPVADPASAGPRALGDGEVESAHRLARAAHPDHDLFPFPDVASVRDRLRRLDGSGFDGLYGWDDRGSLAGCFGLWDYSPVMRMRILHAVGEWAWAAGRDLHLVFLMPLGFRDARGLAEAVKLAAGRLRKSPAPGVARVLALTHDQVDPAYVALDQFQPIRMGFTLFGLELGGAGDLSLGDRPVFVDPADL
jgi:GNAT superfamily N-acetyltransferase